MLFPLFRSRDEGLYKIVKANIFCGLAVIFKRYENVGETKVKGGNTCAGIEGFNANVLYSICIRQEMPIADAYCL